MTSAAILAMADIRKSFGGIEVLHGVDFELRAGEVRALVGQNGAGKSTLMKILAGVHSHDDGTITVNGKRLTMSSPTEAHDNGIRMVFQEFSLVPHLSVVDNIFLNQEMRRRNVTVDVRAQETRVRSLMKLLDVDIEPRTRVLSLSVGDRQAVEIAKALSQDPQVLVLDEPTASLTHAEVGRLFQVIDNLRAAGIGIVFISHHLEEVVTICDSVTVLRDGMVVGELQRGASVDQIVEAMLGEGAVESVRASRGTSAQSSKERLVDLVDVRPEGAHESISFGLSRGEVVGIAGLLGSGRTEILEALFGLRRLEGGTMYLEGRHYAPQSSTDALRSGVVLISEDRRTSGVINAQSVKANMLLPVWRKFARLALIQERASTRAAMALIARLRISTTGPEHQVQLLSGGNQQKVLIGRALAVDPALLMLDEPTAGIDIGARQEIIRQCRDLASSGRAVLWVSSDMQELADVCDRVLILRNGLIVGEVERPTESELVSAIQKDRVSTGIDSPYIKSA